MSRIEKLPSELEQLVLLFASPWKERFNMVLHELREDVIGEVGMNEWVRLTPGHACPRCIYFSSEACGVGHERITTLSYTIYMRRCKKELVAMGEKILADCGVWPVFYPKTMFDFLCPRIDTMEINHMSDPALTWQNVLTAIRQPRKKTSTN